MQSQVVMSAKQPVSYPAASRRNGAGILRQEDICVLLDAAPDALVVVDAEAEIVLINIAAENRFGYDRDELLGMPLTTIVPDGFAALLVAQGAASAAEVLVEQQLAGFDLVGRRKDGSEFPIEFALSELGTARGSLVTFSIRDITVRRCAEAHLLNKLEELSGAQSTLNCIGEAVVCTDLFANITFLNRVAESMSGWSLEEAAGRSLTDVLRISTPVSDESLATTAELAILKDCADLVPTRCVLIRKDGAEIQVENTVAPIHDQCGNVTGAVVVLRDTTVAQAMAQQITHAAEHDCLTDLPNVRLLKRRIGAAISAARRRKSTVAILFLDLDGFKHINDSLGHPTGDKLLQSVASRLTGCVRSCDTVSRQGGDEFVVLLSEVRRPDDPANLAKRLLQQVAGAHVVDNQVLHITTSIGVSIFPNDGRDAETLIKNADLAMYEAKDKGRQGFQFFQSAMTARAGERQSIEEGMRRALEREEFSLHFQPKCDLVTGAIVGAEALIRWAHPDRGLLAPATFIPVAEECGLILPIGNWVLREACSQARGWADAGFSQVTVAVNVSANEFRSDSFLSNVFAVLEETGLAPNALELELTESVFMKHPESASEILQTLRTAGIRIAVDDFGTGYSSLSYLRDLPIDTLKIDQSFVKQVTLGESEAAIVAAVINMAQSLRLSVVAEGVETGEQRDFLQAQHCEQAQGFYFSKAVPVAKFVRRLLLESRSTAIPGATSLPASMAIR